MRSFGSALQVAMGGIGAMSVVKVVVFVKLTCTQIIHKVVSSHQWASRP